MDLLRSIWPTPFKVQPGKIGSLIIQLVIFLIVCAIVGFVANLLASVPVVCIIFTVIGSLMCIYSTVGIILCILKFVGVIK